MTSASRNGTPRPWNRSRCVAATKPSPGNPLSPLWQADGARIRRYAPIEFIGRFFRTSSNLASPTKSTRQKPPTPRKETHSNSGHAVNKTIVLNGTLTGGMASDVFNILYRMPARMVSQGYQYGDAGIPGLGRRTASWRPSPPSIPRRTPAPKRRIIHADPLARKRDGHFVRGNRRGHGPGGF